MFDMQKAKDWSELILKWLTIIAIPIGAWWTYHNFSITDTAELNPVTYRLKCSRMMRILACW